MLHEIEKILKNYDFQQQVIIYVHHCSSEATKLFFLLTLANSVNQY